MISTGPFRIAVLISGTGRTLENLIGRIREGWPVEIAKVISSKAGVRGLEIAASTGIETALVERRRHTSTGEFSTALSASILPCNPDLVVMAGFLSLYELPRELHGKTINIHPSLLPLFGGRGFYGHHVHEAVLASGMRVSGCTVHWVSAEYDRGPIILQRPCAVLPEDDVETLASRVFTQECSALPDAIDWIRSGSVRLEDDRSVYLERRVPPS